MYPLLGDKVLDEVKNITIVDPYEDHAWMLPLATILYVIGTFCCMLMIVVVIIQEHGGNSGFHRTLTNQMMSSLIITVTSFSFLPNSVKKINYFSLRESSTTL